jgi:transketolase
MTMTTTQLTSGISLDAVAGLAAQLRVDARRAEAFGARVLVIDGHDLAAIDGALSEAGQAAGEQPTVILAKTIKGRGFSEVEDQEGWHGKPFPPDMPNGPSASLAASATWWSNRKRRLTDDSPFPCDAHSPVVR